MTFAEFELGLLEEGAEPGTVQAIGEAVAMLMDGVGITAVSLALPVPWRPPASLAFHTVPIPNL